MSKLELLNKLVFGERFSDIHENVSRNNLLVDSYIINTNKVISDNNYIVKSSIIDSKNLINTPTDHVEDSIPR